MISRPVLVSISMTLVLTLLLGGCAGNRSVETQTVSETPAVSPPASQTFSDLGNSTCEAIAQDLSKGDHHALNRRFDTSDILARISNLFDSQTFTPQQLRSFDERLNEMIPGMFLLDNEQVRWDMLRGDVDGEHYFCLVRSGLNSEGLSYVEFDLRYVDGQLRIIDWYDLVRETRVSDLFVELLQDIKEMADAHIMAMPYQRRSVQREQKLFFNFLTTMKSADPKRVLMAYDKLPQRLKQKPLYTLIAVNMASMQDDTQYERILRELSKRSGKGEHYGMLLFDLYIFDQQYEKARQVIHRFKRQVGSDPLLDLVLADLELKQGDKQGFYRYCLKAMDKDPNYLDTYWLLLEHLVADRHYKDAVLVLNVLTKMFEYTIREEALESLEKYREFCKSSEYKAWKAGST